MKRTEKQTELAPRSGLFKVAIIGAASLKGKEIKDLLSERNFPSTDVRLLDDDDSLGQIDNVGDEPTFIQGVVPEHMEGVDFTFFASDTAVTADSWKLALDAGSELIDLSYALEKKPGAQLRSPWIDRELGRDFSHELASVPVVIAHPAATTLGLLLMRIQKAKKVRFAAATVFEPASERGRRGMDELHDQTVNLLSFQQMPNAVFGTQVAFNMLSGFGEEIKPSLASVEERIVSQLKALVGEAATLPSLMLLQAPVFHGHAFSVYIELETPVSLSEIETSLIAGEHVQVLKAEERPSNVNVAGSTDIQVALVADAQRPTGFWLWATADNLRIMASLAVECAEQMIATRPRGKVQ